MCQMRQNSGSTGFSGWLPLPACGVLPAASTPYTVDGDLGAGPGFEGFDMRREACGVRPAASTPCPVDGDLGASPGIRCNTFDVGGMKKAPNNGAPW